MGRAVLKFFGDELPDKEDGVMDVQLAMCIKCRANSRMPAAGS